MNSANSGNRPLRFQALSLVFLMLFCSLSAFTMSPAIAHPSNVSEWPMSGSNDSGWVLVEATGADPDSNTMATGDMFVNFAPGAEISNLTFEIQVNGSDGVWVTEPQLTMRDTQTSVFDWRTYGDFGRTLDFMNGDPHSSRLNPTTDTGASYILPAGASITDLVIEALRPADPLVSFEKLDFDIVAWAIHPSDHRMYIATTNQLLTVDANNDPWVVDVLEDIEPTALALDEVNGRLLLATADDTIHSFSLDDFTDLGPLPPHGFDPVTAMKVDSSGIIHATTDCHLYIENQSGWQDIPISTSSGQGVQGPCAGQSEEVVIPTDIHFVGNEIFIGTEEHGITIWDGSSYTHWDTQNALTSDSILQFEQSGNILMVATADAGIMRRDVSTNSWLASWSSQNWLSGDEVQSLSVTDDWIHILANDVLHVYNATSVVFTSTISSTNFGISDPSSLIPWMAGGLRGPINESLLLVGSSGAASMIETTDVPSVSSPRIFANSPSSEEMFSITRLGDIYWIGGSDWIDRYDSTINQWIQPISTGEEGLAITTDGLNIYLGTPDSGMMVFDQNGTLLRSIDETTTPSIAFDGIRDLSYDQYTDSLVLAHGQRGVTVWNISTDTTTEFNTESAGTTELDANDVDDVATRAGIAYLSSGDDGVLRIDLTTNTVLTPWQSLGADALDFAPIASDGSTVWLGLSGFGVLVYDRVTGEILDRWVPSGGNQPGQGSAMQSDYVISLEYDPYGGVLVGTAFGLERFTNGQGQSVSQTGRFDPRVFYDTDSDSNSIWAATDRGLCRYTWQFQRDDCWDDDDDIPDDARSVRIISPTRVLVGTENGAAVWDVTNEEVIEVWEAGEETNNAKVVVHNDVAYVGFDGAGIQRYDLVNNDWLTPWDQASNALDSDGVTSLTLISNSHILWAGGDFGLAEFDLINGTVLRNWDRGTNSGGLSLSSYDPMHITIHNNILHYAQQQNYQQSRDLIFRVDLNNNTSLSRLDVGDRIGTSGITNSLGMVGDELWVGVTPSQWWTGVGAVVRWNVSNGSWADTLESTGSIERVNAQYLGDCFPLDPADCELWVAYGENYLRRFNANNMTLLGSWDDVEGRIRGMVEWDGNYLFASLNGILRFDPTNNTWLTSWTPSNGGMPSSGDEDVYSMKVIGDDLWVGTYAQSGWQTNSDVHTLNGTSGQWSSIAAGSGNLPSGYPADFAVCADIVHVAMGYLGWWAPGGIGRYDTASSTWISNFRAQSGQIPDDDVRSLACDDSNEILYSAFDTDGIGVGRYLYAGQDIKLADITAQDGISEEAVFPGGLLYHNNKLMVSHLGINRGGFSLIGVVGVNVGTGSLVDPGLETGSIVLKPTTSGSDAYAIGRNGGTSGNSRVDLLDNTGFTPGGIDTFTALSSGRVLEIVSSGNKVWALAGEDVTSGYGNSILEGTLVNGDVRWDRSFLLGAETGNELLVDGNRLWVTNAGSGLTLIDLSTGTVIPVGIGFHWMHDGLAQWNGDLVIGLMGTGSTATGVQVYDTTNYSFVDGKLLAALPSNYVYDFIEHDGRIWVATLAGLGIWNTTTQDWEDPFTLLDGLPNPVVVRLESSNGNLLLGTKGGLVELNTTNMSIVRTLTAQSGLMGTTVSDIAMLGPNTVVDSSGSTTTFPATVLVGHDGQGFTRPGYAEVPIATMVPTVTRAIDMIPDNNVISLSADSWGVHVATRTAPSVHWNATSSSMEDGPNPFTMAGYPPELMVSDGTDLISVTNIGITYLAAGGDHAVDDLIQLTNQNGAYIDSSGLATVGPDGLHLFSPISHMEEDRFRSRRASPLNVLIGGNSINITNQTHPGRAIVLATQNSQITLPNVGAAGPNGLQLVQNVITSVSPVQGAATWMSTTSLNYTGIWDLASLDSGVIGLEASLQEAIRNAAMTPDGRDVHFQLQSPQNGSMWVRLTYDWERTEQPTEVLEFYDRPNDGGGVLVAKWSPSTDHGWVAYRVYIWETALYPNGLTVQDLATSSSITYDARIPVWGTVAAEFTTSLGQPLEDGKEYGISIVTEYSGSQLGEPSNFGMFATPIDDVPAPPEWANATMNPDQEGQMILEWAACTELDPAFMHVWRSPAPITNVIGIPLFRAQPVPHSEANTTNINIPVNRMTWLALVCTDESGQYDAENATIIGPVVWTSEVDDGIPPAPVEDLDAFDTPDDEGGRITLEWSPNEEDDCAYYAVYGKVADSDTIPDNLDGWDIIEYVPSCEIFNGPPGRPGQGPQGPQNDGLVRITVSDIAGRPIQDGIVHWFAVVAVDFWDNSDTENVTIVSASSLANIGPDPPDRIQGVEAWDTPDDDGTSIDVSWTPGFERDLAHYTVWVSEHPVTAVGPKWNVCESDPGACGLVLVEQRRWNEERIEVTIDTALLGGSSVNGATPSPITPGITLYVAVSAHDESGNAFLTQLETANVVPIDNRGDITPPNRLGAPTLSDRANDTGDGLLVNFELSLASDVEEYLIFTSSLPFTDASTMEPAAVLSRSPELPAEVEMFSATINTDEYLPLSPGVLTWVAIVPIDSSGNAHYDNLETSSRSPIDNTLLDPGLHLPVVTGIVLQWVDDGTLIKADWEIQNDPKVRSYWIYSSLEPFEDTREATLVESYIQGNSITFEPVCGDSNGIVNESRSPENETLCNDVPHYIAIVAHDGEVHRTGVTPIALAPWDPAAQPNPGDTEDAAWWADLLNAQTLIIILLMMMILVALVALVVVRRRDPADEWAHLAQGTYGLPQQAAWDDSPSTVEMPPGLPAATSPEPKARAESPPPQIAPVDEYSYSNQSARDLVRDYSLPSEDMLIQEARYHDENKDLYLDPVELKSAAEALRSGEPKSDDLDMSFLDDLL